MHVASRVYPRKHTKVKRVVEKHLYESICIWFVVDSLWTHINGDVIEHTAILYSIGQSQHQNLLQNVTPDLQYRHTNNEDPSSCWHEDCVVVTVMIP